MFSCKIVASSVVDLVDDILRDFFNHGIVGEFRETVPPVGASLHGLGFERFRDLLGKSTKSHGRNIFLRMMGGWSRRNSNIGMFFPLVIVSLNDGTEILRGSLRLLLKDSGGGSSGHGCGECSLEDDLSRAGRHCERFSCWFDTGIFLWNDGKVKQSTKVVVMRRCKFRGISKFRSQFRLPDCFLCLFSSMYWGNVECYVNSRSNDLNLPVPVVGRRRDGCHPELPGCLVLAD